MDSEHTRRTAIPRLRDLITIDFENSVTLLNSKSRDSVFEAILKCVDKEPTLANLMEILDALAREGEITPVVRVHSFETGNMDLHVFSDDFALVTSRGIFVDEGFELVTRAGRFCILRVRLEGDVWEGWEGYSHDEHNTNCTILNYSSGFTHTLRIAPGRPFNSVSIMFKPAALKRLLAPTRRDISELLNSAGETDEPSAHLIGIPMNAAISETAQRLITLGEDELLYPLAAEALSKMLLVEALKGLDSRASPSIEGIRLRSSEIQQLTRVKLDIEADYATKLTIEELSRRSGLNRNKLNDGFKTLFDATVHDYVLICRMRAAKRMLGEGLTVEEVASSVGFSGRRGLTKAIKSYYGVSPRDLKQASQDQHS